MSLSDIVLRSKGVLFQTHQVKGLLIVGDSFSQDFYNMILETGAFKGWEITAVYIPTKCQVHCRVGDVSQYIAPNDRGLCARQGVNESTVELVHQADLVIFVASWREWAVEKLPETLEKFGFSPDQDVLVIGPKGIEPVSTRFLFDLEKNVLPEVKVPAREARLETNALMRSLLPATMFVDIYGALCDVENMRPLFTPAGEFITCDGSHLTRAGARFLGDLLFDTPVLSPYRSEQVRE